MTNLYENSGRYAERVRLLRATVADLVEPASLGPVEGRAAFWQVGMEFWLQAECIERNFAKAEQIYSALATRFHTRRADAITRNAKTLTAEERNEIGFYIDLTRFWVGRSKATV